MNVGELSESEKTDKSQERERERERERAMKHQNIPAGTYCLFVSFAS